MTSNCLVWHHIIRSNIKSALHNTFQAAKSRKTTPLPKQLGLISNGKTINTREPLPLNGQPRIRAVKTNSMHKLTSSKSAARQVAYFTQRAANTTLSSYKSTHALPTTSPFTCPFLCSFSIASHRSLLWRQTWRVLSEWLIACGNKNESEKPHFTPLQCASKATTRAPN